MDKWDGTQKGLGIILDEIVDWINKNSPPEISCFNDKCKIRPIVQQTDKKCYTTHCDDRITTLEA